MVIAWELIPVTLVLVVAITTVPDLELPVVLGSALIVNVCVGSATPTPNTLFIFNQEILGVILISTVHVLLIVTAVPPAFNACVAGTAPSVAVTSPAPVIVAVAVVSDVITGNWTFKTKFDPSLGIYMLLQRIKILC